MPCLNHFQRRQNQTVIDSQSLEMNQIAFFTEGQSGYCKIVFPLLFLLLLFGCQDKEADVYQELVYADAGPGTISIDALVVTEDIVWTDQADEAIDYVVDGILSIRNGAVLSIEAGTVISFAEHAAIVLEDGKLITAGTSDLPVYLVGRQASSGWWNGLFARSDSASIELSHTEIRDTGSSYLLAPGPNAEEQGPSSVWMEKGRLHLNDCGLYNSDGLGIYLHPNSRFDCIRTSISSHEGKALDLSAHHLGFIDKASSFAGNLRNEIKVTGSEVSEDAIWHRREAPYRFTSSTQIEAEVVIEAGTQFIMSGASAIVVNEGFLKAVGSADEPITFRGFSESAGHWKGIFYSTPSEENRLEHVEIKHAGNGSTQVRGGNPGFRGPCSLCLNSGKLSVKNSKVTDGASAGFKAYTGDVAGLEWAANELSAHEGYAAEVRVDLLSGLTATSSFAGNGTDAILVRPGSVQQGDHLWEDLGVPYHFRDNNTVETSLTIAEGARLYFAQEKGLLFEAGSLQATGSSGRPILFSRLEEGNWLGLAFSTMDAPSLLRHCILRNAGLGETYVGGINSGYQGGANLLLNAGSLSLQDCTVSNSHDCGIKVKPGAFLDLSNVSFEGNQGEDVCE